MTDRGSTSWWPVLARLPNRTSGKLATDPTRRSGLKEQRPVDSSGSVAVLPTCGLPCADSLYVASCEVQASSTPKHDNRSKILSGFRGGRQAASRG